MGQCGTNGRASPGSSISAAAAGDKSTATHSHPWLPGSRRASECLSNAPRTWLVRTDKLLRQYQCDANSNGFGMATVAPHVSSDGAYFQIDPNIQASEISLPDLGQTCFCTSSSRHLSSNPSKDLRIALCSFSVHQSLIVQNCSTLKRSQAQMNLVNGRNRARESAQRQAMLANMKTSTRGCLPLPSLQNNEA